MLVVERKQEGLFVYRPRIVEIKFFSQISFVTVLFTLSNS